MFSNDLKIGAEAAGEFDEFRGWSRVQPFPHANQGFALKHCDPPGMKQNCANRAEPGPGGEGCAKLSCCSSPDRYLDAGDKRRRQRLEIDLRGAKFPRTRDKVGAVEVDHDVPDVAELFPGVIADRGKAC